MRTPATPEDVDSVAALDPRPWNSLLSALPVGALLGTGFLAAQLAWALL